MPEFEYKVVPAPTKGAKAKGVKTPEARFANAIEILMNQMAADGWEYQRADMLPSEERQGLTGSTTNWRNILVFRRARPGSLDAFDPREVAPAPEEVTERKDPPPLEPQSIPGPDAPTANGQDTGPSGTAGMTAALKARAAASRSDKTAEGG